MTVRSPSGLSVFATWRGDATTVAEIESELAALRRREARTAVRTAVATLVVPTVGESCAFVLDTLSELAQRRHPCHALVLVSDPRVATSRIDADVRVQLLESGDDRAVCFEDVVLRVRGPVARHLDSIVLPLALPDVPVVVWYPDGLPAPDEALLAAADVLVVDSKRLGAACFPRLLDLSHRLPVVDLSWVRLTPWRELLAGLFGGAFEPFVRHVTAARVVGDDGPRTLMAGWLGSRLDLAADAVTVVPAPRVAVELEAAVDGRVGRFHVRRAGEDRSIHAAAVVEGGPAHERTLRLRDRSAARVLGLALARTGRDHVWEAALAAAVATGVAQGSR